jgi:hypothetical protein
VRVSELLATFGRFAQASRYIQTAAAAADSANDLDARRSADRALLRLSRRLRSTDDGDALPASLASSALPSDAALIRSLQGLGGRARPAKRGDVPLAEAHATWQASWAYDTATAQSLVTWGSLALEPALASDLADPDFDREALARDLRELAAVASAYHVGGDARDVKAGSAATRRWRTWSVRHPDRPAAALRLFLRDAALGPDPTSAGGATLPAELVDRLGPRRCAEIAFEEAELLGLRLPGPAVTMLRRASELYADSNDGFGVFATRTLGAILLTPAPGAVAIALEPLGEHDTFATETAAALAAYESYAIDLGRTPGVAAPATVADLEALAAAPTDDAIRRLQPPELRPWVTRLVACLAVRRATGPFSPADDGMRAWLEGRYAQGAMPVEWARYLERRSSEPVSALGMAAAPSVNRSLSQTLAPLVGLAGVIGVVVFYGWRFLVGLVWPEVMAIGWLQQLGLFGLTLVLLGAAYWVGRRYADSLRTLTLGWTRLEVVIEPAEIGAGSAGKGARSSSAADRVAVSITPTLRALPVVLGLPPSRLLPSVEHPPEVVTMSALESYERLGGVLPPGVRQLVERRIPLLRPPWLVQVIPRGDLQRVAWEGMFTLASTKASDPPSEALVRVIRMTDDGRTAVRRIPSGPLVGQSIAGDAVAAGVVRRALERGSTGGISWTIVREFPSSGKAAAPNPHVVHVIGNTREDHSGIALQLTPVRTYGSQVAPSRASTSKSGAVESASNVDAGAEQVVRAADLRTAYPDASLFIVQGYPPEETTARVGTDREAANQARLFAAELSRLGAAVILIPPLEPAKATEVWGLMSRGAASFLRRGPVSILPSVTKAHGVIVAARRRKDAWEQALDLCVFDVPTRK